MARAFLTLLLITSGLFAAPPVVTLPAELKGEVGTFVTVKAAVSGATEVKFYPVDSGLSVFPSGMLVDKTATVVIGLKSGRYRVLAYAGNGEGASEPTIVTLVLGGATTPPPVEPPPVDPPPVTPSKLYYMVVRQGGVGIPKDMEAWLNTPVWQEIKKAGHEFGDYPFNRLDEDVKAKLKDANGQDRQLPFVAVFTINKDNPKMMTVLPTNNTRTYPTTDEAVRGLLK